MVLTDLTTEPYDRAGAAAVLGALRGSCDAVLAADHQGRPDFPPAVTAAVLRDAGVPGWLTLTCRDRTEVALEQELAGLAEVGVDGVLCVTGDARGPSLPTSPRPAPGGRGAPTRSMPSSGGTTVTTLGGPQRTPSTGRWPGSSGQDRSAAPSWSQTFPTPTVPGTAPRNLAHRARSGDRAARVRLRCPGAASPGRIPSRS